MKLYSMQEIDNMLDSEIEEILIERSNKFVSHISAALKGQEIEAFGEDSEGLWGGQNKTLKCNIKKINAYGDGCPFEITEKKKPYYLVSLDIHLTNYSDDKAYGMMYTDEKSEKSLKKLFKDLLGNDCSVEWSEQGMQGDKHINVDFSYPAQLIAPDFIQYKKYQEKLSKLENESNSALPNKLNDNWPKKPKSK